MGEETGVADAIGAEAIGEDEATVEAVAEGVSSSSVTVDKAADKAVVVAVAVPLVPVIGVEPVEPPIQRAGPGML